MAFPEGRSKRTELLQLMVQDPKMVLLDEPESGVDMENLQVVGEIIGRLLQKGRRRQHQEIRLNHHPYRLHSGLYQCRSGLHLG